MTNQFIYNGESIHDLRDLLYINMDGYEQVSLPVGEILVSEKEFQDHWILDTGMIFGWEVVVSDPLYFYSGEYRKKRMLRRKRTGRYKTRQKRIAEQNYSKRRPYYLPYGPYRNKKGFIENPGRGKRSKGLKRISNKRIRRSSGLSQRGPIPENI